MTALQRKLTLDDEGRVLTASFMVRQADERQSHGGGRYFLLDVFDRHRSYKATVWRPEAGEPVPAPGDVLEAEWKVGSYKGEPQLERKCMLLRTLAAAVTDGSPYVRQGLVSRQAWLSYYNDHVHPLIEDQPVSEAIDLVLGPTSPFWSAAAAKSVHQHWRGGLAEHTHRMLRLFVGMVHAGHPTIGQCRKGLVIAGIVLHDFGKMLEYGEVAPGQFDTTRWGELVGHLAGGPIDLAARMERKGIVMSPELRMHFFHVLLSHHGQLEWGSPVTPKTIEAAIVHYVDNLDGKLSTIEESDDMGKVWSLGGKAVHFPRPSAERDG